MEAQRPARGSFAACGADRLYRIGGAVCLPAPLRNCSKSAALREALHGEYKLKMLMYQLAIPLF
ncbi:hypothetical protein, partial [Chromobacterium haemolyticum]|uniref:hypothetical protein n=1 Tax=Chromobacterium haemolyticum TaxID=394935 RepID=UPI001963E786